MSTARPDVQPDVVLAADAAELSTRGIWFIKGLKERPLKGPLGLHRGFMRLYKGCIRVIFGYWD